MHKTSGYGLIELLVVCGLLAIVLALAIPNLMAARSSSNDKVAHQHANNVYKAAHAHIAEAGGTVITGSCHPSYSAGTYGAMSPGASAVTSCSVSADSDGMPIVTVISASGVTIQMP